MRLLRSETTGGGAELMKTSLSRLLQTFLKRKGKVLLFFLNKNLRLTILLDHWLLQQQTVDRHPLVAVKVRSRFNEIYSSYKYFSDKNL